MRFLYIFRLAYLENLTLLKFDSNLARYKSVVEFLGKNFVGLSYFSNIFQEDNHSFHK